MFGNTGIRNKLRAAARAVTVALTLFLAGTTFAQTPLSLSGAIDTALDNNYGIRIIERSIDITETNNTWGAAGKLPTVTFSATATGRGDWSSDRDTSTGTLSPGVVLNWTLFDGYGISIRKEKLETLVELSKGNSAVVVEGTIEDVILAYYRALLEHEKLAVLKEVMELSGDRYGYVQIQKDIGSAVTYDVLQAKNAWLEDKAAFMQQEVTFTNAVRDLNYLMGVSEDTTYSFTNEFEASLNEYSIAPLRDKMLSSNRTLRNQYINQTLLEKEIALARSDYYPTLSLRAGADLTNTRSTVDGGDPAYKGAQDAYASVTFSIPLFDGGARKRATKIARIEEETGRIEIEEMKHSLSNQLGKLVNLYDVRKNLFSVTEENLDAARLNLSISEDKLRAGTITSFNYRDVQMIYLNASLSRLNAIYNLIDSDTALARITGGLVAE